MLKDGAFESALPLFQQTGESCPLCDQPIPHDRFDEIKARIQARQLARTAEITSRLAEQFAREKANALEQAHQQAAAELTTRLASAREEERRAAEAAANEKLAEAARITQKARAAMQTRIEQVEAAKIAAEESASALKAQLDQAHRDTEATIQKMKEEAEADAAAIHEEARKRAEAEVQERVAGLEAELEQTRINSETAIEKARQDAAAEVNAARQEAIAAIEATMLEKIASAEKAKADAEAKALAAEQQAQSVQETYEAQLTERLNEQREALERAQTEALNTERSSAFEKHLKLSNKVEELQRALDNKTAEELGEGAEIDLYEVLKSEFEGDRIERINKGQPGADILHTVIHNGKECGSIIYDSKNHKAWRKDFVTKLAADQMAAKADHAILSTRKFPEGTRHLHVQDGVILAAPSRVAAVVQITRQHIVRNHTLRLSDEARTQKTAALYGFITSQRCSDLFARIDTHTEDLLDLQVKEMRAHENTWKKQGALLCSVQKVRAEICNEIETIIGTVDAGEGAANE
jgi:hypothetical protein